MKAELDVQWTDVKPLSGMQGIQCIRAVRPYVVQYSTVSDSTKPPVFFTFKTPKVTQKPNTRRVNFNAVDEVTLSQAVTNSVTTAENDEEIFKEKLHKFDAAISSRGMRVRGKTPADGNCFYWALSDQLDVVNWPISHTHKDLRIMTAQYVDDLLQVNYFTQTTTGIINTMCTAA